MRALWMFILSGLLTAVLAKPANAADRFKADTIADSQPWTLSAAAPSLRARSCPPGVKSATGQAFPLEVRPAHLTQAQGLVAIHPSLTFVSGWELSSSWPEFGGLSGLAALPSGDLLAISDRGSWVRLLMDKDRPRGQGFQAPLLDKDAKPLSGSQADAEGLAFSQGLALVSLERHHRILAFDLEGCGFQAQGALLAELNHQPSGLSRPLSANAGLEGLALKAGQLLAAAEVRDRGIPLGILTKDPSATKSMNFKYRHPASDSLVATGLAVLGERLLIVQRHYSPFSGIRIRLSLTPLDKALSPGQPLELLRLNSGSAVDNFEALAVQPLPTGDTRLFLLADDNFSQLQKTLLLVFDFCDNC